MRALIIVDVQNDFCPGGALATERGDEVAASIANYLRGDLAETNNYAHVAATQDWHIDPGTHFSDEPDFVESWPRHCEADTHGAAMHEALADAPIGEYFRKGQYSDGYSGFEGVKEGGAGLADWLRREKITELDIVGIATDHCVRATVLDALKEGFQVRVLTGMCAAVDNARGDASFEEVERAGAELV